MGKRKRPADATTVQYEQAPSRGRIVQTVQDKAGNLYNLQNDSGQQSGQTQTTTTTYYQIHTKVQPSESTGSVIQEHRTTGGQTHQTHVVQHQQPQQQPQDDNVTFKCVKCDEIFESKSIFMEHCNQLHYFACDLCTNSIFDDLYQLNVHMLKHINKYDMCEKCNMVCSSTEELKTHLGGHITTYDKNEVVFANNGQATNALSDDSLIEHLASELDQSIGNTVKVKPQKYRCGVCKQDFSDPKTLFKHMNQVHINLQTQVIQQQLANPSPPLPPPPSQTTVQVAQQQPQQSSQSTTTLQENVVYTNIDSNNIFYDERTGQYYTIALMDNASPLSDAGGSGQSVIEYVQDTANLQQVQQHIEYIEDGHQAQETIIIEDESQHAHISQQQQQHHQPQQTHNKITHSTIQQTTHLINSKQQVGLQNTTNSSAATTTTSAPTISTDPPPLVQITRDTDLEELIPTTTLVADTPQQQQKVAKHDLATTTTGNHRQTGLTKCENCQTTFIKKLPKQMFCHNCVTRNTSAAANKH